MCCKCYHIIFSTSSLKFKCKACVEKEVIIILKSHFVHVTREELIPFRGGRWDFQFFGFWPFSRSIFRFCCPLWFPVFPFLASGFRFFGKNNAIFRILVTDVDFGFSQFGRTSKTNLHGLPMWFLWLCRIINCLQVTILLLQACLF